MNTKPKSIENPALMLRGRGESSVQHLVDEAKSKGWSTIHISGSNNLCRATWFEAKMSGLGVTGYSPSQHDQNLLDKMVEYRGRFKGGEVRLSGSDIAQDYNNRVLPYLQKEYEDLKRERRKAGIRTTDMDRAYGINLPKGEAAQIDERFDRVKASFLRAIDSRDRFLTMGKQMVPVKLSFEDGVARFVPQSNGGLPGGRLGPTHDFTRR